MKAHKTYWYVKFAGCSGKDHIVSLTPTNQGTDSSENMRSL
jgi:hypothetical protein